MNQKGFASVILVVVIIAIVAIGGYFIFFKKTVAPDQKQGVSFVPEENRIQIVSPKGGEKLEVGKTYDIRWANYSGQEPLTIALQATTPDNKVSAKIIASNAPAASTGSYGWTITSENPDNKYKIEVYPAGGRELVGRSENFFTISGEISGIGGEGDVEKDCLIYDVWVGQDKLSVDFLEGTPGIKKEQVYVDGIVGEKITEQMIDDQGFGISQIVIQAKKDDLWFRQTLTFHPTNKNNDELYAISDSFRFAKQEFAATANLKTYVNNKYGFEIKYPSSFVKLREGEHYLGLANFSSCK